MGYIGKRTFMDYMACPTLGWMSNNKKIPKTSGLNGDFLNYESRNIRHLSHKMFANALDCSKEYLSFDAPPFATDILNDPQIKTIKNAKFNISNFTARVEILQRDGGGSWKLFETRAGGKSKLKYVNDIAFNVMLLEKAGIQISKMSTIHIAGGYRLGKPLSEMFYFIDCTDKVREQIPLYIDEFEKISKIVNSPDMPQPVIKRKCKNCPAFNECIGKNLENSIFDMPKISAPDMDELINSGVVYIKDIPEDFELNEQQKRIKDCVQNNTTYISPNLKTLVNEIKAPYYYLDFESISNILPVYPDFAPHSQVITQFSIHKCNEIDKIAQHFEYIADPKINCQEIIVQKLIEYLGDEGSIITYSNSENLSIKKLAQIYPQYSQKLLEISSRIVDFEALIRLNYYNVRFKGRNSIKVVLPALVDMNYENLEIAEGGDAAAAFAFMAIGLYDEQKCQEIKENLLKYCAQDTMAMVKIHKFLFEISNRIC
ncbi:MAG: DUF2779 domain-containing protein [Elusimicrobiota bacterium]|jgi:hypothetical protein|nr:DUF2779 domain-containing protein [Elusimicrobiota bacterium]